MATQLVTHLDDIASGYTIFEANQVLTHEALNTIPEYLDDQVRLSRVALQGVGIRFGLEVSLAAGAVALAPGVAVTTDGDLIRVSQPLSFTRARDYHAVAPDGSLFKLNGVFELVPENTTISPRPELIPSSVGPNSFAVLYVESCAKDSDECTGADCDNQGRELKHTLRLLVMSALPAAVANRSTAPAATGRSVAAQLPIASAPRVIVGESIASAEALAKAYNAATGRARTSLDAALAKLAEGARSLAGGAALERSVTAARDLVTSHLSAAPNEAFQARYSFARDCIEVYGAIRAALFDDTSEPAFADFDFAKHVELGTLGGSGFRTPWFPVTRERSRALEIAARLAGRLAAMAAAFESLPANSGIRVTPSRGATAPLSRRAIPAYYKEELKRNWDETEPPAGYRLGEANADAAFPLEADFFRIEGHLGLTIEEAEKTLRKKIVDRNLPISVRSVLVGKDLASAREPETGWSSDLHRVYAAVNYQMRLSLLRAKEFGAHLANSVASQVTTSPTPRELQLKRDVADRTHAFAQAADRAVEVLELDRSRRPINWRDTLVDVSDAATRVKNVLPAGEATADGGTPYDEIAAMSEALLEGLDRMLDAREAKLRQQGMLHALSARWPGAEHHGGASAGGTFLLAYEGGKVIADFALPYWSESEERSADDPVLRVPEPARDIVIKKLPTAPRLIGIRLLPPIDNLIRRVEMAERTASLDLVKTVMSSEFMKGKQAPTIPTPAPDPPQPAADPQTDLGRAMRAQRQRFEAAASTDERVREEKTLGSIALKVVDALAQARARAAEQEELLNELAPALTHLRANARVVQRLSDMAANAAEPGIKVELMRLIG